MHSSTTTKIDWKIFLHDAWCTCLSRCWDHLFRHTCSPFTLANRFHWNGIRTNCTIVHWSHWHARKWSRTQEQIKFLVVVVAAPSSRKIREEESCSDFFLSMAATSEALPIIIASQYSLTLNEKYDRSVVKVPKLIWSFLFFLFFHRLCSNCYHTSYKLCLAVWQQTHNRLQFKTNVVSENTNYNNCTRNDASEIRYENCVCFVLCLFLVVTSSKSYISAMDGCWLGLFSFHFPLV